MPSVLTGANLANRELIYLGVSGDGDSASIGMGQFAHVMRRGVNMVYIVENNGVYGLTKGQFSATADQRLEEQARRRQHGCADRHGVASRCSSAQPTSARSFSGDKAQLVPLIKGAIEHGGAAFIDVISPCVAFNNHPGSTKSYDYVREHNEAVNRIDFIEAPSRDHHRATRRARSSTCSSTTAPGCGCARSTTTTTRPTASRAMNYIARHQARGEVVTGLLFVDPEPHDLHAHLNTVATPFNALGEADLCPGAAALEALNRSMR